MGGRRVLLVDLNNFARYPSIPIGLLAAVLRRDGDDVRVFSPLSVGFRGVVREGHEPIWGLVKQRLSYWSSQSNNPLVTRTRRWMAERHAPRLTHHAHEIAVHFRREMDEHRPDAVLVSTYLMYYSACALLGEECAARGVPMLVGGPYFSTPAVREAWINIPGLRGLVGGEVEHRLSEVLGLIVSEKDASIVPGVFVPDGGGSVRGTQAPPLTALDQLPHPDYSDFPWSKYPNRIVPMITGRGCGWGACLFCSDVTSTAGRTFRSHSLDYVREQISHHARVHHARLFVFTDLKLNSSPAVWRGIIQHIQTHAPGAAWVGAVHVGRDEEGLDETTLRAAKAAGLARLTTGLESGSQRVLDAMAKGASVEKTGAFLIAASNAGISVRTTMILGYPGELARDVETSAAFLETHTGHIDRVTLNRFNIVDGTRIQKQITEHPQRFPGQVDLTINRRLASISHHNALASEPAYRKAVTRLLAAAHRINRKPLRDRAADFSGVM